MDQETYDRSKETHYQYYARELLDLAQESGYTYIDPKTNKFIHKDHELFIKPEENLKITDPELVMRFAKILMEKNMKGADYFAQEVERKS